MTISLIAAMSENRVIGLKGQLPWHIPEDLKFFKETTAGKPVVMGRKTFDSLGKPLPKRRNIVVTRDENWSRDGCERVSSLDEAYRLLKGEKEIFVIGGGEIYKAALSGADRIYLTVIHQTFDGDAYFPEFDTQKDFRVVKQSPFQSVSGPSFTIFVYERSR